MNHRLSLEKAEETAKAHELELNDRVVLAQGKCSVLGLYIASRLGVGAGRKALFEAINTMPEADTEVALASHLGWSLDYMYGLDDGYKRVHPAKRDDDYSIGFADGEALVDAIDDGGQPSTW